MLSRARMCFIAVISFRIRIQLGILGNLGRTCSTFLSCASWMGVPAQWASSEALNCPSGSAGRGGVYSHTVGLGRFPILHGKEGVCTVCTFDSIYKHLVRSYTYLLFVTSYGYWILQICKRCGTEFLNSLQPVLSGAVDRRIKTRSAVLKLDTAAEPRCVRLLRRGGVTEEKPAT